MFSYKGDVGLAGAGGLGTLQTFHQTREALRRQQLLQAERNAAALALQRTWRHFQAQRALASAIAVLAFGRDPRANLLTKLFLLGSVPLALRWRAPHSESNRQTSVSEYLKWQPTERERMSWLLSGRIRSAADLQAKLVTASPDFLQWRSSHPQLQRRPLLPPIWQCAVAHAIESGPDLALEDLPSLTRSLSLINWSWLSWQRTPPQCDCRFEFPTQRLNEILQAALRRSLSPHRARGSSFRNLLSLCLCGDVQGDLIAEVLLFSDAETQDGMWKLLSDEARNDQWPDASRVLVRLLAAVSRRKDAGDALTRRAAELLDLCQPLVSDAWRSQMAEQTCTEDLRIILRMFIELTRSFIARRRRIPVHLQSTEDNIDFLPIIASLTSRAFTEGADEDLMQALGDRDVLEYLMTAGSGCEVRVSYLLDLCFPLRKGEQLWCLSVRGAEPLESQSSDLLVDWMFTHPSDDIVAAPMSAADVPQPVAFQQPSDLRFFEKLVSDERINAFLVKTIGTELFVECRGNITSYVAKLGEVPHLQSRSALYCKAFIDAFLRKSLLQDDAQFGELQPCQIFNLDQAHQTWMSIPATLVGLNRFQTHLLGAFAAALGFELIKLFDEWAAKHGLSLSRPNASNASGVSFLILDAIKLSALIFRRGRRAKWSEDSMVIPEARSLLHLRSLHVTTGENLFPSNHSLSKGAMLSVLLQGLHLMPHIFPFKHRMTLFYALMRRHQTENGRSDNFSPYSSRVVTIRRNCLLEDSLRALNDETHAVTEPFRVRFLDADGYAEDGVDGGGLLKEWAALLAKFLLAPENCLFRATADESVIPNVDIEPGETSFKPADLFRLLGLLCGKALYEGILLSETAISLLFLNRVLGLINTFDDLQFYDSLVYRNVKFVRDYEGDVAELNLNFAVTIGRKTIALLPNGQSLSVTNDNKLHYCFLMPHHLINNAINEAANHFREGLTAAVPSPWIAMFDGFDLAKLLHGVRGDLDLVDWKANTQYAAPFTETSETISHFWEILETANDEFRTKVLFFVTSLSRPPLLGFGALTPLFGIASSHTTVDDLPSASTCVNLLKLPDYKDKQKLRDKLEKAVSGASGFYRA